MLVMTNQTSDKVKPRLYISQGNTSKVKMEAVVGPVKLGLNISSGLISLGKRNRSLPFMQWIEPESEEHDGFQNIRYVTVEVSDSGAYRAFNHGK